MYYDNKLMGSFYHGGVKWYIERINKFDKYTNCNNVKTNNKIKTYKFKKYFNKYSYLILTNNKSKIRTHINSYYTFNRFIYSKNLKSKNLFNY